MTAETCGSSAMPANVAPPLKSTSTKLSSSEECVIARPSTSVRRNSDLPEPVAPMTRPCGPMPCWADSLMSRSTSAAAVAEPDRHPQPVARGPRPPGGAGVEGVHVAEAEQVHEVGRPGDLAAGRARRRRRSTVCSGVSRRANASAVATVALVGQRPDRLLAQPQRDAPGAGPRSVGGLGVELQPQRVASSSSSQRAGRSRTSRRAGRRAVRRGCRAAGSRRRRRAACAASPGARRRRTAAGR